MGIKLELLRVYIADFICERMEEFEIDASKIADTVAIKALSEIQKVIQNYEIEDFDAVEEIVMIFEKYKLDFRARHDF